MSHLYDDVYYDLLHDGRDWAMVRAVWLGPAPWQELARAELPKRLAQRLYDADVDQEGLRWPAVQPYLERVRREAERVAGVMQLP